MSSVDRNIIFQASVFVAFVQSNAVAAVVMNFLRFYHSKDKFYL